MALSQGQLSATDLAQSLVGKGVTISNVSSTGDGHAAGEFSGMQAAVGIDKGVVLSSGSVVDDSDAGYTSSVLGPNTVENNSGEFFAPGDTDLTNLLTGGNPDSRETTHDASVLEFDFVPTAAQISIQYVFASDEYNEFIGQFDDVFGFFVNGTNCATTPQGQAVNVNDINNGSAERNIPPSNPDLYRDNDPADFPNGTPFDTQMDGLTTVLTCTASVIPRRTNHIKLAIADTDDFSIDSDVFIQAGSFTVNNPPTVADDSYSTANDTALTVPAPGVLANDSDPEGDPFTVDTTTAPTTTTAGGTVALSADGGFEYTPPMGFFGTDTFDYQATDGLAQSAPATVSIAVAPPAPVANDDAYSTPFDTPLSVDVSNGDKGLLSNDEAPSDEGIQVQSSTAPHHGTVTVKPDGSFVYTPTKGFSGDDTFTYQDVSNGVASNTATVTITVHPGAQPTANPDSFSVVENQVLNVGKPGVLGNDTDSENRPLTAALVDGPAEGTLVLRANGSFTYTPTSDFKGQDTFTYRASDGQNSSETTVTITVNGVFHPVTPHDDSYTTSQNQTLSVAAPGVLANDDNPDGRPLTVTIHAGADPVHGTLQLDANGGFTYVPERDFVGTDGFEYDVHDGESTLTAAVHISVTHVDRPPTAEDHAYTTNEDTALNVAADQGVLQGASDPDGDTLTAVRGEGPAHGALTLNDDGSFTYVPDTNFSGSDTFTYRTSDGVLTSNPATVTISVVARNDPPLANGDTYLANENATLHVSTPGVLGNDTDPENDPLTAVLDTPTGHGTVVRVPTEASSTRRTPITSARTFSRTTRTTAIRIPLS